MKSSLEHLHDALVVFRNATSSSTVPTISDLISIVTIANNQQNLTEEVDTQSHMQEEHPEDYDQGPILDDEV